MPRITLVRVPSQGASAVDYISGTRLTLGESADVDDATVARLRSVEPIGYRYEVEENAPAAVAGEPAPNPAAAAAPTDSAPVEAQ